jgi:hypothetical protein
LVEVGSALRRRASWARDLLPSIYPDQPVVGRVDKFFLSPLYVSRPETFGELLAVIGQHLRRNPPYVFVAATNASVTARADGTASTAAMTTCRE